MTPAGSTFSPAAYRDLIGEIVGKGYLIRGFADADPFARHLVLRHDIDMSLDAALAIADIERQSGWRATYFILPGSEFYNPFTPASRKAMEELRRMGHGIGLHFDAAAYVSELKVLEKSVQAECALIGEASGGPVEAISFHRPAPALQGLAGEIAGRPHAYAPRFFSEMGYCSDSQGGWHYGHPLDHPALRDGRALQLLTHPIWWTAKAGEVPAVRLRRFLSERGDFLDRELAVHCRQHRPNSDTSGE